MTNSPPSPTTRRLDWTEFHRDSLLLARLLAALPPFAGLLAVSRGGLVPAAIVAWQLHLRMVDTVCVVSYDDSDHQTRPSELLKSVSGTGRGWLVIDDLVDSGATFGLLRQQLPEAHFAAVYGKPAGLSSADTVARHVEQAIWLEFPWEQPLPSQTPGTP